jgi:hypothetical protein
MQSPAQFQEILFKTLKHAIYKLYAAIFLFCRFQIFPESSTTTHLDHKRNGGFIVLIPASIGQVVQSVSRVRVSSHFAGATAESHHQHMYCE